ncbi:MAG TPA: hypothetical protein VIK94_03910, partial [Bacilli bacterium]
VLLNHEIKIYDVYHQKDNYLYHIEKPFKVVGIIRTNQLGFYNFNSLSKKYELLTFFKQQYRNEPYMNTAFSQPYGYIVTMEHLDADQKVPYYYDLLAVNNIYYNSRRIDNRLAAFIGVDDYKGIDDYEDNLFLDVSNRIIVKDTENEKLEGNEILITTEFLRYLEPSISLWNTAAIINAFNTKYNGAEVTLTLENYEGLKEFTFKIVGVARQSNDNEIYISEDMYDEISLFINGPKVPTMIVELNNKPKERMKLIEELYDLGYVLNPVNILPPGAYSEFVETQGEIEVVDDEGFSEIVNISLYHLFSEYYNTKEMNEANSVLEIFDSIYVFCIVMGALISIGFIYLKERRQKDTILKLSQLGVVTRKIIFLNIIHYIVMAISIGILTILATNISINFINNLFTIQTVKAVDPELILGGQIYRIRLLFTNTSIRIAIIAAIVTFIVGSLITWRITYKYRR